MDTLEKRSSSIELAPPTHRQVIPKPGRGRFPILKQVKDRFRRTEAPRTEQSMLPMLIEVFAGFTNLDGYIGEEEVDSILGFLRYDYPETVYSELRKLFIRSLGEEHDLEQIAGELSKSLPVEEKFLLGVQLYVLISRAGLPKENLITFYQFMTNLGVASEAINIVYQLNTNDQNPNVSEDDAERAAESAQRLETVLFSTESEDADVMLLGAKDESVTLGAFRYQDLLLVKNIGKHPIIARGRQLGEGEFCRVFEGQRILAGEEVLTFQDLIFYLNAKKDVSSVKVFLAQDNAGNQIIEKSKSKFSYLRVIFGLKIEASVIAQTDAKIAGKSMEIGSRFEVHPNEIVEFTDYSSITFADLRKRAKELGGRFSLQPNRRDYLVSDNPKNLRPGDLLLSPGAAGEILLKIECNEQRTAGEMFVLKSEREITVENQPVRDQISLADGSIISIGEGQYLRCHFADGIIEEERNVINQLKVRDVGHSYDRKVRALDSVSLSIQRGEMVCVMGPSGCGKSTLLKTIAGQLKPAEGKIRLNGVSLYDELESLTPYIAFVPQDETFDSLLTVEENMDTAAAIRAPHFTTEERRRRADARLVELGLNELRHRIAGDEQKKNLSGGQRRRLNAGMDMIGIADVYLFDEPTSGLSSKDSEHVLEMIRGLTHNRITLVSIHQPSSRLFQMFDKVVLLDNGGKLAFFGTPTQMLEYFYEARVQEGIDATAYPMPESREAAGALPPDFVFDILETPLQDFGGDVIYERDDRGNPTPARRFSPTFWSHRFQTHRLLEEVNLREIETDTTQNLSLQRTPKPPRRTMQHEWVRFRNLFKRAFLSKLRNKSNFVTTLLEAPALGAVIGMVLRYSEEGDYTFQNAFHIPTYFFMALVVALFLGLTNSAEEIIRDRSILNRERHHGLRVTGYILSKYLSLAFFALIQCVIFLLIADSILGIRGMFFQNLLWMFCTALVGIAAGLFVSSVVSSPKTAVNLIPMILIPNIILGGALIKYEEMNKNINILNSLRMWFAQAEAADPQASHLKVPAICHLMPLRWSYESLIIAHAEQTLPGKLDNYIDREIEEFTAIPITQKLTDSQSQRLGQLKDARVTLATLEAESPSEVGAALRDIKKQLQRVEFDPENYQRDFPKGAKLYTPDELFSNEKIQDLFMKAEIERLDTRRAENPPNVFFGKQRNFRFPLNSNKPWISFQVDTLRLNFFAMSMFVIIAFILLRFTLKRQLRKV